VEQSHPPSFSSPTSSNIHPQAQVYDVSETELDKVLAAPVASTHLTHPTTGADVFLIGASHVSTRTQLETRALIWEVKPDVVVIELDNLRFRHLMAQGMYMNNPAAIAVIRAAIPVTTMDGLGVIFSGRLPLTVLALWQECMGVLLAGRLPFYLLPLDTFTRTFSTSKKTGCVPAVSPSSMDLESVPLKLTSLSLPVRCPQASNIQKVIFPFEQYPPKLPHS
jgi:hypothetical protein